jgi:TolA-binding protein
MRLLIGVSVAALALASPGSAQRQPTPEQRINQLERQLRQVQGRVFQRGQPADTAGFDYEPAAPLSALTTITDRLASLERQMADIQRLAEENGNRVRTMENALTRLSTEQDGRIATLERRVQELAVAPAGSAAQPSGTAPLPTSTTRPTITPPASSTITSTPSAGIAAAEDPGEEAYSAGFRLWQAGQYNEAIASLRQFIAAYPNHRRISWAHNLTGRALLDSGQPREAATVLLANYRSNPKGERAADSLYYLGQSLMQLNQPSQACNAYAELEAIYGKSVRADLQKLVSEAKAQAQCR